LEDKYAVSPASDYAAADHRRAVSRQDSICRLEIPKVRNAALFIAGDFVFRERNIRSPITGGNPWVGDLLEIFHIKIIKDRWNKYLDYRTVL